MKKRITYLFSSIFVILSMPLFAQNIGIGEWRDHLSYHQTKNVAAVGAEVYVSSPYGLFVYNQEDEMINRLSKINGLSDMGFNRMAYHSQQKSLFILYDNCNIDVIKNGTIYNLPDIKNYTSIANRTLNNIYFDQQFAYICSNFGIVVINIEKMEITDTYKMGEDGNILNVFDVTSDDSCFYAATEKGIYKADKNNTFLSYFGSWKKFDTTPHIDRTYKFIDLYSDSLVYVLSEDVDYVYKQSVTESTPQEMYQGTCYDLNVTDDQLIMSFYSSFRVYQNNNLTHFKSVSNSREESLKPRQVVCSNGIYWIADYDLGLLETENLSDIHKIGKPNGPFSYNVFDMTAYKNQVWVSSGYYENNSWMYGNQKDGVFSFDGSTWRSFNAQEENVPQNSHDFCVAAVHPSNPAQTFVGTWGCGLYQFDENKLTNIYNTENSTLQPRSADVNQGIFVSGVSFDSENNLWVANSSCNNLLSCRYTDGTWKAFNLIVSINEDIRTLTIDENDQKWIISRYHALLAFKESADGNHAARRISVQNSEGGDVEVYSIAFDKKGTLWIGTDDGIILLDNPYEVLEKSGSGYKSAHFTYPKIEWDGYTRPLLSGEIITDILVNGNNDKWISTKYSGLYKISEFGSEQLEHFTTEDSPIFSNDISALCQTANGELFIGTSFGVISYRDVATEGKEDNSDVYVFPNPVRPEYNGLIAITNVADKSYIKITDISGTLVYNTQANGGQAVWNGKNLKGQRVKTGVYLVFITNEDGTEKEVTKIMFLN